MFGKGIVKLGVADKTKIGTPKMMSAEISMEVCVKAVETNGRMYSTPCYMIGDYWNGINVANFN